MFVLPWDPKHVGGVSGVVKGLADALRKRGSPRPLIVANTWGATRPQPIADGLAFDFSLLSSVSPAAILKALPLAPVRLWRTLHLLRSWNVQVINFHYPGLAPLGAAVLKRLGAYRGKLVLSYHGTDVVPARNAVERVLRDFIHRSADHLVACSYHLAARMQAAFDVAPQRIRVIHNGVDPTLFDGRVGAGFAAELPASYLVSISSFIPRKNLSLLLQAFALLAPRFPDLHLCIAGGDGPERERIARQANEYGLAARVHLFVDVEPQRVAALLAGARACVQTSLTESFPLAVLEAGACGTPLVVSAIPGHDELVHDGIDGRTFALGDPADCAAAIESVLNDPAEAARMACVQKQRIRSTLTWSAAMSQYLRLAGEAS